ncbi:MAG: alpha/beta hydrolase-fold protein [Chloroflexota bacterium]
MAQLKGILSGFFVVCLLVSCTVLETADIPLLPTQTLPPPTITLTPTITPTPEPDRYSVSGFENFIAAVTATDRTQRQGMVNQYVINAPQIPIVSQTHAIFLWQGTPNQVDLIGDMTHWNPEKARSLTRLENTDLWYLLAELEPDALLDYKFLIDGETDILDPSNLEQVPSGSGLRSLLKMPDFQLPEELTPTTAEIPAGTLKTETIDSQALQQIRTMVVYTPAFPAQSEDGKYPSVIIHDGSDYLNYIEANAILDRLIAEQKIPPIVAIFIPPLNRYTEYERNDDYVKFLADEVMPFAQSNYNVSSNPAETGTLGASMGGLISAYTALSRPETFGLVGSQSGAVSYGSDGVIRLAQLMDPADVRLYINVGTYETEIAGTLFEDDFVAGNNRFVEQLQARGYDYTYKIYPTGHSWGFWQATLGEALIWMFGAP